MSEIVDLVGESILSWRNTSASDGTWEGNQLKTTADAQAHQLLVKYLRNLAPDIPIISEEDSYSQTKKRPDRYFLIDPIDGTASFSGGFPGYVTQIAFIELGQPKLAAVRAPEFSQTFLAESGNGALLNGVRLSLSGELAPPILIDNYPSPRGISEKLFKELKCEKYVECGGISLKICRIADGTADLFVKNVIVRDWDVAPAQLILEEAGGFVYDFDIRPISYSGHFDINGTIATRSYVFVEKMKNYGLR